MNELILWAALAVLIALLALAVWAGRRGLHALGVVGPGKGPGSDAELAALIAELRRLNANLEKLVSETSQREQAGPDQSVADHPMEKGARHDGG